MEKQKYDLNSIEDFFEDQDNEPKQVAARIREVNLTLFKALAELLNHGIKFEVNGLTLRGVDTMVYLAEYIDLITEQE